MTYKVRFTKFADKQVDRLPERIVRALRVWVMTIELEGIQSIRKLPGYNDEALKGDRKGQRSSRLNRAYRVIYEEDNDGTITLVSVLEVNKHDY
jgi:proteic killer suppression protein